MSTTNIKSVTINRDWVRMATHCRLGSIPDDLLRLVRRTRRARLTWSQWVEREPALGSTSLETILSDPASLTDAHLRALVRIARSDHREASKSVLLLVWSRMPAINSFVYRTDHARQEEAAQQWVVHITDLVLTHSFSDTFPIALQINSVQLYLRRWEKLLRRDQDTRHTGIEDLADPHGQVFDQHSVTMAPLPSGETDPCDLWYVEVLRRLSHLNQWHPDHAGHEANAAKARAFLELTANQERIPTRRQLPDEGIPASCHGVLSAATREVLLAHYAS